MPADADGVADGGRDGVAEGGLEDEVMAGWVSWSEVQTWSHDRELQRQYIRSLNT
jgi:hypothetical protein